MHNANIPDYTELPSTKKLLKETAIAIVAAAVAWQCVCHDDRIAVATTAASTRYWSNAHRDAASGRCYKH